MTMKPIKNIDFFKSDKSSLNVTGTVECAPAEQKKPAAVRRERVAPLHISGEAVETLKMIEETFAKNGMKKPAAKISAVCKQASRERFAVAVVGEFSRGKSTFINKLLDKELLPVADLPTTAIMTRIRSNSTDTMVLVDEKGAKVKTMPAKASSWEGLVADNFTDNDPKGVMFAGIDNEWLEANSLEIIDTPGAGDLEEKRAKVIGDALVGCDGAIITISALSALSMSEKLFIEQRLISRKTPFLMLIITKLDLVPFEERAEVIGYIKQKLDMWGMDIPVYVPYDVEISVDTYDGIIGMDNVKACIEGWVRNPKRARLTEEWLLARAAQIVDGEIGALNEQLALLSVDDSKRKELIEEKKRLLSKAKIAWEDTRIKLMQKCNDCYSLFLEKVEESKVSIVERLQFEASHSNNLQKWWAEDYPYRLKIELTNMSVSIENVVSRRFSDDARWFNSLLEQQFKSHVIYDSGRITDKTFFNATEINSVELEDLNKKRIMARVGTTAVSLALYPICAAVGFMPLIATMGVSTGSSIITEKVFGGKVEKQRQTVKDAIAVNVPQMIDSSIKDSEGRLKAIYDEVIKSAVEKENEWLEAQYAAIENSIKPENTQQKAKVEALINTLKEFTK